MDSAYTQVSFIAALSDRSGQVSAAPSIQGPREGACCFLRHHELAHLLSNIEKLPLPIWGSIVTRYYLVTYVPFLEPNRSFPSVGYTRPTRRKGHPLVVSCFLSIQRPSGVNDSDSEGEATPGPDLARVHSGRSGPTWFQRPSGVNEGEATPGPDLALVHSGRSGPTLPSLG